LKNDNYQNHQLAMMVNSELMQFGFICDKKALDVLSKASKNDIVLFHDEVITYLKNITGSNRTYKPFWSGFPQQVMEMSEYELWLHQIVHYMSNGTYVPNEWTKERSVAFEQPSYTKITGGDENMFLNIFTDLVSVNQSLTPQDLDTVKWFVNSGLELRFPKEIPFKENLCTLAGMKLDVPVKTVTDVLRICVHMSGGDISLPKVPRKFIKQAWGNVIKNDNRITFKLKKFSRRERKYILNLLEKTNCDPTEAVLKQQRWVRLGEILHPGEYKNRFPKSFNMFDKIRNEKVVSWYGKLNESFGKSFKTGLDKLSERPGEFVRRLDWLIRNHQESDTDINLILDKFEEIGPKVSNKVLYETYVHFEKRIDPVINRSIMIKGSRKNTPLPNLPAIHKNIVDDVIIAILNILSNKISTLPKLGKVWIDEELKKIPLPTNMRSISESLKPIVRGSRIPIGNKDSKVIRAFVHWFDDHGDQDVDLTSIFVSKTGGVTHIGWNGTHASKLGVYSGDVRHVKGACAEYIDIDLAECKKQDYKYVVLYANNYTGRGFDYVKDCVFGWMEREYPKAGLHFVPSTLSNTMRLMNKNSNTIVSIIDLETMEYIYLDVDVSGIPVASANVKSILSAISLYSQLPKLSVYDLLKIHAEERGQLVEKQKEAEVKFKFKDFSEDYINTLKYMGV
jgi:hypothetical protein